MYANILYGKNTANFVVYKPSCCIFTSRHFAFELSVCFTCRHFAFELPLCFTCHHFAFELPLCFTCRHFAFELPLCFTCRYFAFELALCFTCHYFVFELPVCFTSRQSIYILHRYRYLMNIWTLTFCILQASLLFHNHANAAKLLMRCRNVAFKKCFLLNFQYRDIAFQNLIAASYS